MSYDFFSLESDNDDIDIDVSDSVTINDETAIDEAGEDSETVDVSNISESQAAHNEAASAGGVVVGNNLDDLEMDPVAAEEAYIMRHFGLSREDLEEAVDETVQEADNYNSGNEYEDNELIQTSADDEEYNSSEGFKELWTCPTFKKYFSSNAWKADKLKIDAKIAKANGSKGSVKDFIKQKIDMYGTHPIKRDLMVCMNLLVFEHEGYVFSALPMATSFRSGIIPFVNLITIWVSLFKNLYKGTVKMHVYPTYKTANGKYKSSPSIGQLEINREDIKNFDNLYDKILKAYHESEGND